LNIANTVGVGCREKVNISPMRAFITIEGAGADKTVVQWGDTAETVGSFGRPLGTFGSATFAVNSAFFVAKNITFKVSIDRLFS
jgi:pectinesterase